MYLGNPQTIQRDDDGTTGYGNMIFIVDPQTHEILDYITLDNVIDDNHRKNLETYLQTYDAIIFGGGRYDKHLEKRNLVIIPDEDGTLQEFVLFEVDKYRDTEGRKTHFYAHASYLELKKANIIYPDKHESLTASQLGGIALNNTGWQIGIVEATGTRTMTIENHTSPYEFIKRIAREFEVELRFRVETDGQRITGRYVDMLERIGEWRGRQVEFGRDLDGIRRIEKQDIVTALLGLGPEKEDGTRLEVLVEDEDALQRWGRVDEHGNLHHLIEPYEIQSDRQEMTEEEARQYTRTALDKRINTQVGYETTVVDLEEVPGMSNKKIRFGDTLQIKDTEFNPPLYLEARVYEMTRSLKHKAKKDIKLGDYIEYTEEEVSAVFNQLRNEIRREVSMAQVREYAEPKIIESATPPPIEQGENAKWIDTSGEIKVPHVVISDEWVKMSPTEHDISDADRLSSGIIDVGQVPLRTSVSGARLEWDGVNGLVQYNALGEPVSWLDLDANAHFANAFLSGRIEALEGYFGVNQRVRIGNDGLTIERPDGAVWMEDGLVHQDYAVTGADPHRMDEVKDDTGTPIRGAFIDSDAYYRANADALDGTSISFPHQDIRDQSKGYTVNFQRYYFIHSARYFVIRFQPSNRSELEKLRVRIYDGSTSKYSRDFSDSEFGSFYRLTVDLGIPTYDQVSLDLRIGFLRQWKKTTDSELYFRLSRVYLTDFP